MRIKLHLNKSVYDNAAAYYELAKEAKKKREGLTQAMEETKKEMEKAKKKGAEAKKVVKIKREKQWFEKFHWFRTSAGRLAVGGRSAQQNDLLGALVPDLDLINRLKVPAPDARPRGGIAMADPTPVDAANNSMPTALDYTLASGLTARP